MFPPVPAEAAPTTAAGPDSATGSGIVLALEIPVQPFFAASKLPSGQHTGSRTGASHTSQTLASATTRTRPTVMG